MAKYIECEALLKSDDWQSLKSDFDKARAHIIILGQPAADVVEVVHGEWIEDCDTIVHCSVCKVARNNYFGVDGNLWHYCPNCGAKMDDERGKEE